jgi:hypothetical protein
MSPKPERRLSSVAAAIALVGLVGCGGSRTLELSGTATFGGKPIPAGRIYFTPDTKKGNNGPQGFAEIKDGTFDTRDGGRGPVGGPTIVILAGNDGSFGNGQGLPLFDDYSQSVELSASGPNSFDVPANAPKPKLVPAKRH